MPVHFLNIERKDESERKPESKQASITSAPWLSKVADDITYIKNGQIILSDSKENIVKKYSKVRGENSDFEKADESKFISYKKYGDHFEGLIAKEDESLFESNFTVNNPTIEDVMIFLERGDEDEEFTL